MRILSTRDVRASLIGAMVVTGALGGVGLGTALTQPPAGEHDAIEAPPELAPKPETATIEATAADPSGTGPVWGVRVSTSQAGGTCMAVGRTSGSALGWVTAGGEFVPRPQSPAETCAPPNAWEQDHAMVVASGQDGRVVIHGVAGPKVQRILIDSVEQRLSAKRAFVAVFDGDSAQDAAKHPVVAELADGSRRTYPFDGPPVTTR
jgi:hypothetical protein